MTRQSTDALKSYFVTGLVPTEAHFAALIESGVNLVDAGLTIGAGQQFGIGGAPGATLSVRSQYNRQLTGTVTTTNGATTVQGTQTKFTAELLPGDMLNIANGMYEVTAIASDSSLSIDPAFPPAPAPVATQAPAFADAGVSLLCADAAGTVRLRLDPDGALAVGALAATGAVSAASFSGDGAGLCNVPVAALTGAFSIAQLPAIPASAITGQLASAQIPDLRNRNLLFYAPLPGVPVGSRASVIWRADFDYVLTLELLGPGGWISLKLGGGPGSYRLQINQRTLLTLTARNSTGAVQEQRQVWIDAYHP